MSETKKSRSRRTLAWLLTIGKARDGILVLGGSLYLLGYLVVSVNAWMNGLGLLPILEAQYLVAGLPAAIILFLIYLITVQNLRLVEALRKWLDGSSEGDSKPARRLVFKIVQYSSAGTFGFLLFFFQFSDRQPDKRLMGVYFLAIYLMLITQTASDPEKGTSVWAWLNRKYNRMMVAGFPAMTGVFLLALYILLVYPKLPRSFGGIQPRCAYVDLAKNEISPQTLASVLPAETPSEKAQQSPTPLPTVGTPPSSGQGAAEQPENKIVRSDKVEILFSGGDYTLIRVARSGDQNQEVYEIKKEAIHAVTACK